MSRTVIFTDLDETLLERGTYSFEAALPGLGLLREAGIPLVMVSSKSHAEIEHYRRLMDNLEPFSSENGGGIFIPEGYFGEAARKSGAKESEGYEIIELGVPYPVLRDALARLGHSGLMGTLRGFGDMEAEEVSRLTGLSPKEARMARQRHYDEPFTYDGGDLDSLRQAVAAMGLGLSKGRLWHLKSSSNDKGKAVVLLKAFFREKFGEKIRSVALGDSHIDVPMLLEVDVPVLIRKDDGSYLNFHMDGLMRTEAPGPAGFSEAIKKLI